MWRVGFIALTVLLALAPAHIEAACNECSDADIACISENQFHLCYEGEPDTSQTFTCPQPNQVCAVISPGCIDKAKLEEFTFEAQGCGDTSKCGDCSEVTDGGYACTSRTTFTMCIGNKLSEIRSQCKDTLICDSAVGATGALPCVLKCHEKTATICDRQTPIDVPEDETTTTEATTTDSTTMASNTTTVAASTTEPSNTTATSETTSATTTETSTLGTSTTLGPDTGCGEKDLAGRYPNPDDSTCRTYVYCFRRDGVMEGAFLECPEGKYFNGATTLCEDTKPASCT